MKNILDDEKMVLFCPLYLFMGMICYLLFVVYFTFKFQIYLLIEMRVKLASAIFDLTMSNIYVNILYYLFSECGKSLLYQYHQS